MTLFSDFQDQIEQSGSRRFLVAFSGGLDSTALLLLFTKLRQKQPHFEFRAIHIHHALSPHADAWLAHCRRLCASLEIPFIAERVKVEKSQGIEAGAREARYRAIASHLLAGETLVTAHHLQDQSETFLLALKRGSGLQGLSAMQVRSHLFQMPLLRPLLNISRPQLEEYLQREMPSLRWVEDESNLDNRYERNFLRNDILPRLRRRWPHFDKSVQRAAQHCFEQQQLLNELLAEEFERRYCSQRQCLNIADFHAASVPKQCALLRLWFSRLQINMPSELQLHQLRQDLIFSAPDAMPQFHLGPYILRRYRQYLYITAAFQDLSNLRITVGGEGEIRLPDNLGLLTVVRQGNHLIFRWQDKCSKLPLTEQEIQIRFGYSGKVASSRGEFHRDIKKIWQRLEVPPWQRKRIPLVFYADKLQSAVGFFDIFSV
ncbi:tRNA(Ile)-lysidine synthase [Mesocricetibacter intestinalis]|uniref:tRNA(Ile)-lysidine synthase n=1 Tax=Mesocricetibacter intestinalis TaxID=1521930 RepID=A0A4R6VC24_9PAST|nr:tRNA lysidine(34) synthetase TilS [Mesocricetibacter intestinalis]TDQ59456.1 tRNA(Ile)-lysidine synthase [Mesocricetibacter intestinalis]